MAIKICLDAGHYGKYNRSPAVPAYYESDMNWKLHLLLKAELEAYGITVKQTRAKQAVDMELTARGRAAKGCDLFLSIHSNAVGNRVDEKVDYVAVYHLQDDTTTKIDEESKALAGKIAPAIAEVMGVKQDSLVYSRKSDSDRNGDGIMNDNYYGVLHGARSVGVAGLILEHSFHTNTRSTKWLMDENNLRKLAVREAEVIAKYYGLTKKDEQQEEETAVWYRVQVGAFREKKYADDYLKKVEAAGFVGFVTYVDGWYKVQVGAFHNRDYAVAYMENVKAAGFDAFITCSQA